MKKCTICFELKEFHLFDKSKNQCRKCKNIKRRETARLLIKKKPCYFCNTEFYKNNSNKFCSEKCRLLSNIEKNGDCWFYQGSLTKCGYGKSSIKGKFISAHRHSYQVFKGDIPRNMMVCHSCDNKKCINPDHLWLGSAKQNMQDARKKGLLKSTKGIKWSEETRKKMKNRPHSDRRGEKHHLCKLTAKDVYDIREMLNKGIKQPRLAEKYGVNKSCISAIKNRRIWVHI